MKKLSILSLVCFLTMVLGSPKLFAIDFSNGTGKQVSDYLGLGNPNEALAFAYYTGSSAGSPSVSFKLFGSTEYISEIKIYARPYVSTTGNFSNANVSTTDAELWDYRNPIGKNNAILLGKLTNIPATGVETTLTSNTDISAGNYMIYVTADVKSDVTLPSLQENKIYIGGVVTAINSSAITTTLINNGNSRILVPQRSLLYAPGDYYSKYYRIPSITKAADGSLIALSDARKYRIYDIKNNIDVLCRRSLDNGLTWSNPITIAQGSGASTEEGEGYGDAAVAALPNGDLIATMIHGYPLNTYDNFWEVNQTNKTTNWYSISHDNGQSWSTIKEITSSVYENRRGCIAPGNMIVVKSGYLKGKVLACFRSYRSQTLLGVTSGNALLVYDSAADKWSNLSCDGSVTFAIKSGEDDESHLIEIGENTFLMSIRSSATGARKFLKITLSSATACSKTAVSFTGMDLKVATNGDIIPFTANLNGVNTNYMFQTLPASSVSDGASNTTRSGLTFFYAPLYSGTGSITWNKSIDLYDPLNVNNETAQYSSITEQNDGTLGFVFEAFPTTNYHVDQTKGDYIMATWYMNLRVEDLIPGAKTIDVTQLTSPDINPSSSAYLLTESPNITISNPNTIANTKTYYTISTIKDDVTTIIKNDNFVGSSKALNWSDLGITLSSGMIVKVMAYCSLDGYKNSSITTKQYIFSSDIRYMKVDAKPTKGYGNPTMTVTGLGTFAKDEVVKVAAGMKVTINAPGESPFSFNKFTYDLDGNVSLDSKISNITVDNKDGYQISFAVPTVSATDNNNGDELVVYAWYNGDFGIMSEAYIYSGDNTLFNPDSWVYPSGFYTLWSTSSKYNTWPSDIDKNLSFGSPTQLDNELVSVIKYPKDFKANVNGVDACLRILPDYATSLYLNAVVLIKKDGEYLKNYNGTYSYYLINGCLYPYSEISSLYIGALDVQNWFALDKNNPLLATNENAIPKRVDDCTFHLSDRNVDLGNFEFEVYIVGSTLKSVDTLVNGSGYVYKVAHPAQLDSSLPTGINSVNSAKDDLSISYNNSKVVFSTLNSLEVKIYNVIGELVDSFNLNGSKIIDLPSGVYIANGKKFIIR